MKEDKKPVGRPCTITDDVLLKLKQAFSIGASDAEACVHAGVSPASLYRFQLENPDFKELKETLKKKPTLKARDNIMEALNRGDTDVSKWYLEKKENKEFNSRTVTEPDEYDDENLRQFIREMSLDELKEFRKQISEFEAASRRRDTKTEPSVGPDSVH